MIMAHQIRESANPSEFGSSDFNGGSNMQNPDKVYKEIYKKVMAAKNPTMHVGHRIAGPAGSRGANTFDTYKEGWNKIQDRSDQTYQKRLR